MYWPPREARGELQRSLKLYRGKNMAPKRQTTRWNDASSSRALSAPRCSATKRRHQLCGGRDWRVRHRRGHGGIQSAAQTALIPLLMLGVPANAVMGLMLGAMTIHGVVPGPDMRRRRSEEHTSELQSQSNLV